MSKHIFEKMLYKLQLKNNKYKARLFSDYHNNKLILGVKEFKRFR